MIALDTPNAFIQTCLEDENERVISVLRGVACQSLLKIAPDYEKCVVHETGKLAICLECTNVTHGTLKAALSFHGAFAKNTEAVGFELNPHDGCTANKIANGKQMTMLWHVEDAKASHEDMETSEEFAEHLRGTCDDEEIGAIKANCGPRHDF